MTLRERFAGGIAALVVLAYVVTAAAVVTWVSLVVLHLLSGSHHWGLGLGVVIGVFALGCRYPNGLIADEPEGQRWG